MALLTFLAVLIGTLIRNDAFSPLLPPGFRVQNTLLALLLILTGSSSARCLISFVVRPGTTTAYFMDKHGALPPLVAVSIVIYGAIVGTAGLVLAFRMAQLKIQAYDLGLLVAPLLFIAFGTGSLLPVPPRQPRPVSHQIPGGPILSNRANDDEPVAISERESTVYNTVFAGVLLLLFLFCFWLFFFCKSKETRAALEAVSENYPPGEPPPALPS